MECSTSERTPRKLLLPLLSLVAIVAVLAGCRPNAAYHQLSRQIREDSLLIALHRSSQSDFPLLPPPLLDSALYRAKGYQLELQQLERGTLNEEEKRHLDSLARGLRARTQDWMQYQKDPARYSLGATIKRRLSQQDQSLEEKLRSIETCLDQAGPYYRAAKENIQAPAPERIRLATQKQVLGLRLLTQELPDSIRKAPLDEPNKQKLRRKLDEARLHLKDYIAFCESLWFEHLDSLQRPGLAAERPIQAH